MSDFEKELHAMFDHIWDCKIDHPVFQDTVGDLMKAVIQAYEKHNIILGTNLASLGTDCISRQAAIDAVGKLCDGCDNSGWCGECRIDYPDKDAIDVLEALPPVLPKRGKWKYNGKNGTFKIYTCDQCGWNSEAEFNFCPHCGADMRQREE